MKNLTNKTALAIVICGLTLTATLSHGEGVETMILKPYSQSLPVYDDCIFIVVNGMGQWVCF